MLLFLINLANKNVKTKNILYQNTIFELYQWGADKKIFIQNNKISDFTFLNITISATTTKEFQWGYQFVKDNKHYLRETLRDNTVNLCKAYLYFNNKEFEKAQTILSQIETPFFIHRIRTVALKVRTLYECYLLDEDYLSPLESSINSLKSLIKTEKELSDNWKRAYTNYANAVKKMIIIFRLFLGT